MALHNTLFCSLPTTPGDEEAPLWGFFYFASKTLYPPGEGVEDASASSDMTKAPFVA